jgi:hypothetical protein
MEIYAIIYSYRHGTTPLSPEIMAKTRRTQGGGKHAICANQDSGKPFQGMREFALAERPHGLHMSLPVFKVFRKDIEKDMEEINDYTKKHKNLTHQEAGKLGGKGCKATSEK